MNSRVSRLQLNINHLQSSRSSSQERENPDRFNLLASKREVTTRWATASHMTTESRNLITRTEKMEET